MSSRSRSSVSWRGSRPNGNILRVVRVGGRVCHPGARVGSAGARCATGGQTPQEGRPERRVPACCRALLPDAPPVTSAQESEIFQGDQWRGISRSSRSARTRSCADRGDRPLRRTRGNRLFHRSRRDDLHAILGGGSLVGPDRQVRGQKVSCAVPGSRSAAAARPFSRSMRHKRRSCRSDARRSCALPRRSWSLVIPMDLPVTPDALASIGGFDQRIFGRYLPTTHIRASVPVRARRGQGAPLLNAKGEVVGILSGAARLRRCLPRFADPGGGKDPLGLSPLQRRSHPGWLGRGGRADQRG